MAVDDRGKEPLAADPLVKEALRRNWMVWAADPRGIGELALTKPGWAFAVSLLLGENFVWRQAWDIRRVLTLAAETPRSRPVALYARGHNAALAAGYAATAMGGPVPAWTVLREGFTSFRHFYRRPRSLEASYRLNGRRHPRSAQDGLRPRDPARVLRVRRARRGRLAANAGSREDPYDHRRSDRWRLGEAGPGPKHRAGYNDRGVAAC